jgi:hypothetical protein
MVSEALATSAGEEIFGEGDGRRHGEFVAGLIARGLARPFEGDPTRPPARTPIDSTGEAAQAVRRMLAARASALVKPNSARAPLSGGGLMIGD